VPSLNPLALFILTDMRFYWVKTNFLVKMLFRNYIWNMPSREKKVYITFDDGPTPSVTPWVLQQLKNYNAKATFFCIGNNIKSSPELFRRVSLEGHAIGNHTQNHLNGWHVDDNTYLDNVAACEAQILKILPASSKLFRPPYGKLNRRQSKSLRSQGYKVVMWDILSADFDVKIAPNECLNNVLKNICPGTIIIFHDSEKAFPNLEYALPKTLQFLSENGYACAVIK
jgi:peptidoglycan/xylan/chitin deacetylase (PgdA/CDA1 family)